MANRYLAVSKKLKRIIKKLKNDRTIMRVGAIKSGHQEVV